MRLRHKRRLRALYRKDRSAYNNLRARQRFCTRQQRAWARFLYQWLNERARFRLSPAGTAAALADNLVEAESEAWSRWVAGYRGKFRGSPEERAWSLRQVQWDRWARCP